MTGGGGGDMDGSDAAATVVVLLEPGAGIIGTELGGGQAEGWRCGVRNSGPVEGDLGRYFTAWSYRAQLASGSFAGWSLSVGTLCRWVTRHSGQ